MGLSAFVHIRPAVNQRVPHNMLRVIEIWDHLDLLFCFRGPCGISILAYLIVFYILVHKTIALAGH